MVTDVRPVQPEKVYIPRLVTPAGMVTAVSDSQLEKALWPRVITVLGMATFSFLQPENARMSMTSNPLGSPPGMVRFAQLANASAPIFFSVLGKEMVARFVRPEKLLDPISVTPSFKVMDDRLVQPLKADEPIVPPPIIRLSMLVQFWKALLPISSMALRSIVAGKPLQP